MPVAIDTEAAWIARVVADDDRCAFAALVRLHQASVRRFLCRLCGGDWARADDLAQETFWKAYRHMGSFRGEGQFLGWLLRIAWQLFVSEQRRKHVVLHGREPREDEWPATDDTSAQVIDHHTFDQLLRVLRDEERAAVVLHYRHDLAHADIADTLQLPLGTVKSLLLRARQKMQHAVESESGRVKS